MIVTGSSGLIGSEVCRYFGNTGWHIHGVDNNSRAVFFGPKGDTRWNQRRLEEELEWFDHHELDVRDRHGIMRLIEEVQPAVIVHAAAQPSHDLAAKIPFDDFDTNAGGTLNLLEATRRFAPGAVFVYMSTNKVYGDAPNLLPLIEERHTMGVRPRERLCRYSRRLSRSISPSILCSARPRSRET